MRNKFSEVLSRLAIKNKKIFIVVADISPAGKMETFQNQAKQALDAGNEALALEVLEKVGELEAELSDAEVTHNALSTSSESLESQITSKKRQLKQIKSKMNQPDDDFNFQGDQNVPF
mgnify:CR=1 FL=1